MADLRTVMTGITSGMWSNASDVLNAFGPFLMALLGGLLFLLLAGALVRWLR